MKRLFILAGLANIWLMDNDRFLNGQHHNMIRWRQITNDQF